MDTLSRVSAGFVEATGAPAPPPIDDPRFVPAEEAAEFVAPEDEVFLVEAPEGALVFPRTLMRDYEVVNTIVGRAPRDRELLREHRLGGRVLGHVRGITTTFEPTRLFVNRNIVLAGSGLRQLWPQLLGIAVRGHLEGLGLERFPVYPTTWDRMLRTYPDARVLAMDPTRPPPAAREADRGAVLPTPMYVPRVFDDRLPDDEEVVGVWLDDAPAALPGQGGPSPALRAVPGR